MKRTPIVYLVDDEEELRNAGRQTLELADISVETFSSAAPVLRRLNGQSAVVIVSDIRMPEIDGVAFLERVRKIDPELPVILVTGHGDVDLAVRTMQDGAYDFIEKPYDPSRLVDTIRRAIEKRALTLEVRALRDAPKPDAASRLILGRSQATKSLRQQIRAIGQTDTDVLIRGDTGTGKRVAAQAIHALSKRKDNPFVEINCAALPATMIESELFGHEAGAFPGAMRPRSGRFEHARGGTVLLDEIDSLTPPLQAKLLHVIQSRAITRLGSNDAVTIDLRFIATSKRDLAKDVASGAFRGDLFYLLGVSTLDTPKLSERQEDIPLLFSHFVAEVSQRYDRASPKVSEDLFSHLMARPWAGNVRELENAAERFALGLDIDDATRTISSDQRTLAEKVAAYEKAMIAAAISANGGSLKTTYEALGLSRKTLYEKMQKYGLTRHEEAD